MWFEDEERYEAASTTPQWSALFIDNCYVEFGLTPDLIEEVDTFLRSFKPAVVGSPSFKDVVQANPDMDVMKGMKGVGIKWPAAPARPLLPDAGCGSRIDGRRTVCA